MAEERTLGLARAHDSVTEEPSKEELQRRMDQARDSISHTVTEIKETVANQVQAVKETLDWREQVKRRPVAWSLGAAGTGFALGYCIAAFVKGDDDDEDVLDFYSASERSYAAQPILGAPPHAEASSGKQPSNGDDDGPGLLQRLGHTPAFNRVKAEASNVGDAFVQELGKTAKQVVLPALITSLKNFIGGYLPKSSATEDRSASMGNESTRSKDTATSSYQPTLERGQS